MSIGLATKGMIGRAGGGGSGTGDGSGAVVFVPFGGFVARLGEIAPGLNVKALEIKDINIEIKKPIKDFRYRLRLTTD